MGHAYSVRDGERTVMLEPFDGLDWDHEDEYGSQLDREDAWEDMLAEIRACLPSSLRWLDKDEREWIDRERLAIARGCNCEVVVSEDQGGYGYAFVTVKARDSFPGINRFDEEEAYHAFARQSVPLVAGSLFDKLARVYELRIPGGYVSSAYRPFFAAA